MKKLFNLFFFTTLFLSIASAQYTYIEKDHVLRIDVEQAPLANRWAKYTSSSTAVNGYYYVWEGGDNFGSPGIGIMEYKIQITNPGTYHFLWHSKVGNGSSSTDFNDSWLRIPDADDFYGLKNGTSIVHPKGVCTNDCPEGAGSDGWFKVYSSGTTSWTWSTNTSDNDGHQIYAKFDAAGVYTVQISARSSHHFLDRFVLFNEDHVSATEAKSLADGTSSAYPFRAVANDLTIVNDSTYYFSLTDIDTSLTDLMVSSSNETIAALTLSDQQAETAQVNIIPVADQAGSFEGIISFKDGDGATQEIRFNILMVDFINKAPTIDIPESPKVNLSEGTFALELTGISDGNGEIQELDFDVASRSGTVVAFENVEYTKGESTASCNFNLLKGGSSKITITLSDDGSDLDINENSSTISFYITVADDVVSIGQIESNSSFEIYPTTASESISIRSESAGVFTIYNTLGKEMKTGVILKGNSVLDISEFDFGYYIISLHSDNGTCESKRFFIQK